MAERTLVQNAQGALATARATADIVRNFPTTPQQVETFLANPTNVNNMLRNASVIAQNADNPLVAAPLGNSFVQSVRTIAGAVDPTNTTPQAAAACARSLIGAVNTAGGPQIIAASGKAMAQCLNTPAFTAQLAQVSQDGAALVGEIRSLNSQISTLFPSVGQVTQTLQQGAQHGLSTATNILSGVLGR